MGAGSFNTLAAALTAGARIETLKGDGPFTGLPQLMKHSPVGQNNVGRSAEAKNKEKLVAILTYHVVPGSVMAADVVKLTSAKTVNGADVTIKVDGSTVMVNDAKVTATDIRPRTV